jgi:hypothetical protein
MNATDYVDFFTRHGLTRVSNGFFGKKAECDLVGALLLQGFLAPNQRCDTLTDDQWQQFTWQASDAIALLDPTNMPFRHGLIDGNDGNEPFVPDGADEDYTALYEQGYAIARDVLLLLATPRVFARHG